MEDDNSHNCKSLPQQLHLILPLLEDAVLQLIQTIRARYGSPILPACLILSCADGGLQFAFGAVIK
jgi:hypothetical protein